MESSPVKRREESMNGKEEKSSTIEADPG